MTYKKIHKARSHHPTRKSDGTQTTRYSPYEIGMISGSHRDVMAIVADSAGFDGLGFDVSVGSNDDSWHVFSVFDSGQYVDSLVIGGALDNDHALAIARAQLDHLGGTSCVMVTGSETQFDAMSNGTHDTWSIDSISKLMNNESQDKPYLPLITASELNHEAKRVCFDGVQWDHDAGLISHGGKLSSLQLDLTRADSRQELTSKFDLAGELASIGATPLDENSFDALMETKARLDLLKNRLFDAMKRASSTDGLTVEYVTQTKPFKRQGVANIAIVFDLSDGQTVSIWFHNPDSTPTKLLPSDIMISWKWMLNKRDVTAVLSPKQGDNVRLPILAKRILLVASKNSKRFKATQERKIKEEQELLDAQNELNDTDATIAQLDADIAELNAKIDEAMKAPKVDDATANEVDANEVEVITDSEDALPEFESESTDLEPIVITGQEIEVGDDVDFKTAKNNAMAYFDQNLKDKVVFCPAIDSDVLLRRRGGKHIAKANHTFREKLKLVAAIPAMIKQGKYGHYTALNKDKGSNIEGYYVLNVDVIVGDDLKAARVVLEKNNEGKVLYDIGINKKEALVALGDTATNETFDGVTGSSQYQDFCDESYQADDNEVNQFDRINTETMVLNLFFDDEFETETTNKSGANSKVTEGRANESTTIKGTKISSKFALVEAKNLITSHDASGVANPKFPQELQPRDRSDEKSVESIKANSKNLVPEKLGDTDRAGNGAPIIGDDLIVESGNGRAIVIKSAYDNGDADNYRAWLVNNAGKFGFTAEQVETYQQPVLVRIRNTKMDRISFTIESNLDADPKYFNTDADQLPPVVAEEEPATEAPVPVSEEKPAANELGDRISEMETVVNANDFDPTTIDSDELANLLDQAEGDEVLTGRITAVIDIYQDKLIAVSLQALTNLKGDQ
ncbi:hypothetical protein [Psychrobacter sp. PAMC 21119]|uniref:defense against restriction DarA-related protein n=1 Tax=Psychrobacter sp. PAMC 21119 TaxID=1112209 RepID=UPI000288B155|nr:hypothetical protein [Psychrobacter sp. PAMC 21119]